MISPTEHELILILSDLALLPPTEKNRLMLQANCLQSDQKWLQSYFIRRFSMNQNLNLVRYNSFLALY